jgi:hypothetical protein
MQVFPITNRVNTHTTLDRRIKQAVALKAKATGLAQTQVINSVLATGLKVASVGATKKRTGRKTKMRRKTR